MSKDPVWFYPMATATDNGHPTNLFTYDSVTSIEKALNQFSIWEDGYGYQITEAWIHRTDGKRIDVEKTTDGWKAVQKGGGRMTSQGKGFGFLFEMGQPQAVERP